MPDSAQQLQRIYLAGFELQTFERYPKCIGVARDNCVALLVPGVDGLQILGTPGWRMGEVMGVLTEREGRKVFQAKTEIVEATPEPSARSGVPKNSLKRGRASLGWTAEGGRPYVSRRDLICQLPAVPSSRSGW